MRNLKKTFSLILALLLIVFLSAVSFAGHGKHATKNACNPCGTEMKNVCNPCNPCGKDMKNACNPCGKEMKNACNPCGKDMKNACNPCNPCGKK